MNGYESSVNGVNKIEIRIIPYPPSFKRMAAKIIDPATGASTCAFGNQRWAPYSGILIINAIRQLSHKSLFVEVIKNNSLDKGRIVVESVLI